ncbi:hypothetical protein LDENG_00162120 [Lucifuga dentata]|nr:hypothetical protein LDENG_00162120 [Lucifuga dentata]
MDHTWIYWLMMCLGVFPLQPAALNCSVTVQPGGRITYRLSHSPRSPQCQTWWDNENRTVLARDSQYDPKLVHQVDEQSISLNVCVALLHYTADCPPLGSEQEKTDCTVNCSSLLIQNPPKTVNSTLICITENFCLDHLTFSLVLGLGLLGVLVMSFLLWKFISRRRQRLAAVSALYSAVDDQVKMETGQKGQ